MKLKGLLNMAKKSTGSVQSFYPEFCRERVIQALSQGLDTLQEQLPCLLVVLLGSYARGKFTAASDVDLLVVYRGEENGQVYAMEKRVSNIPRLEPQVYKEDDCRKMKNTLNKMIRGGALIHP